MPEQIKKIDDDNVERKFTPADITENINVNETKQNIAASQARQDACVAAESDLRQKLQAKLDIAATVGVTPKAIQAVVVP